MPRGTKSHFYRFDLDYRLEAFNKTAMLSLTV